MTKQETTFDGYTEYDCEFITGSCVLKRDTNVDVGGTVNGGSKNGKDDLHGTWGVSDGWING